MKQLELTGLLRMLGGALLVGAASIFLVQGLEAANPFTRFGVFFGLVAVLGAAGLLCVRVFEEPKSARGFLGLMTAGIAVQFAQVGAMTSSLGTAFGDSSRAALPKVFLFQGMTLLQIGVALALTVGVLVPLAYLGFRVLARPLAKELTLGFLGAGAILLVPLRDPLVTCGLLLAQTAILVPVLRMFQRDPVLSTVNEGRWSQAILAIPVLILAGRGMFYENGFLLGSVVAVVFAVALLVTVRKLALSKGVHAFAEFAALFLLLAGTSYWGYRFGKALQPEFYPAFTVKAFLVMMPPVIALMILERLRLLGTGYFQLAAIGAAAAGLLPLLEGEVAPAFLSLGVGIALLAVGYERRDRGVFKGGVALILLALAVQATLAVKFFSAWPWLTLALLGVAALLIAAWAERRGANWQTRYENFMRRFPRAREL